jgi:hypothetical protein
MHNTDPHLHPNTNPHLIITDNTNSPISVIIRDFPFTEDENFTDVNSARSAEVLGGDSTGVKPLHPLAGAVILISR